MISKKEYRKGNIKFGKALRRIRLQRGLKQVEVAVATNLDRTYLSRIETGKARVTESLIEQVVKGLGIKSSDILDF